MNARTLEGNPNVYLPFSMEKGKMKLQEAVIVSEIHFFYINIGDVEKLVGKIAIEGEKEMNAKYLNIAEEKLNNAKLIDPGNARIEFLSKVIADYKKILSDTNE